MAAHEQTDANSEVREGAVMPFSEPTVERMEAEDTLARVLKAYNQQHWDKRMNMDEKARYRCQAMRTIEQIKARLR